MSKKFGCDNKVAYSYEEAMKYIKRIRRFRGARRKAYKCKYCAHWHTASAD